MFAYFCGENTLFVACYRVSLSTYEVLSFSITDLLGTQSEFFIMASFF
jgi:hypothetical protein